MLDPPALAEHLHQVQAEATAAAGVSGADGDGGVRAGVQHADAEPLRRELDGHDDVVERGDFRDGKATLPVILAYARGSEADRVFWKAAIEGHRNRDEDFTHALSLVRSTRAIDDTMARARHYGQRAIDALAIFPNGKAKGQSGGAPGSSENAPGHTKSSSVPPHANGNAYGHSKAAKPPPGSRGKGHSK